ncbi:MULTISPECIES: hypothetical protein [Cytobacillus]|uniref:hypothetical protein n=1 Tax=Cytobacillus TaxID=2675230 RepID=UPI00207A261C|nr:MULTISPECIES: hypothetical protein [Cytobacillus]MED3576112.1 hypothetical protein [Cytobacillus praedii]USK57830.1 hypothetical protein LIS82_26795 [Cytobacillus solani]
MSLKKYDKKVAVIFAFLTLLFLIAAITSREFLDWLFTRHQNQLSWYIRPLFLIPFCFFAFKKSWAGISITIFCIFTSMFWFPEPQSVNKQVEQFLAYEIDYLTGDWNVTKIMMTLLVPISLFLLGMGFWRRNLWIGLSVLIMIAIGKIMWSILSAGKSGNSIIIPAIIGLLICVVLIYWGFKKLGQRDKTVSK